MSCTCRVRLVVSTPETPRMTTPSKTGHATAPLHTLVCGHVTCTCAATNRAPSASQPTQQSSRKTST
jgi:hypothetical protein